MASPIVNNVVEKDSVRKVQFSKQVEKNLLDLFWKLAETKNDVRLKAVSGIIRIVAGKQEAFEKSHGPGKKCAELDYVVERLIRGLSSTRQAARQGFTVTLEEVLRLFPILEMDDILQCMDKHLPTSVRQDKCQMVIGQLMGYVALFRSGRLQDSSNLSLAIMNLFRLSIKRDFLQPAAYRLMLSLFSQLSREKFKDEVWPHLKSELKCGWENATPQILAFLLLTVRLFPESVSAKFLVKHWGSENLVSVDNFEHWKTIIKRSTMVSPHIHPVCCEFLDLILERKLLKDVWDTVIDDNLFEREHEKSFLGFQIVKEALRKISKKKLIKVVISSNFRSVFHRSYANRKSALHSISLELASFFSEYVEKTEDPHIQMIILKSFLQPTEAVFTHQILKRKEVVLIISHLTFEAVKSFYGLLKEAVFHENQESDDQKESHEKHQAVIQIGTLISHRSVSTDMEWRTSVLKFLFLHAYFRVVKQCDTIPETEHLTESLPMSVRQSFALSFMKGLDSMTHGKNSLETLQALVDYADYLLSADEFLVPIFELEKVQHPWYQLRKLLKKLRKHVEKEKKVDESHAFQVLLIHLGLQLFFESSHTAKVLEDLNVCCRKCLKLPESSEDDTAESEDEPPWVEVMIDALLSLMSQSSQHTRRIVGSVFPLFCPFLTESALQLIFDVINPPSNSEPPLGEEIDEEEEVEFVSGSSDDEENKDESPESDDEKEDESEMDDELRNKLQAALGSAGHASDAEDSDVVFSDTEMFKLDGAIAKAFQSRKRPSSSNPSEQKTLADFKQRCMDLVVLYLKMELPLSMVLKCIKPVLTACSKDVQIRKENSLAKRAVGILRQLVKIKKFKAMDVDVSELDDMFKYLINKIHSESSPDVLGAITSLCIFLVQCEKKLLKKSDEDSNADDLKCIKRFQTALEEFVEKSSTHAQPLLFLELINKCPEYAWMFMKPLEKYAFSESVRLFRKAQCLGLMNASIKFSKAQTSVSEGMWTQFAESIVPKAVEALRTVLGSEDIKPTYTTELLELLVTLSKVLKEKTKTCPVKSHKDLLSSLLSMKGILRRKCNRKNLWKQLIVLLGGKVPSFSFEAQENESRKKVNSNTDNFKSEHRPAKRFKSDDASSGSESDDSDYSEQQSPEVDIKLESEPHSKQSGQSLNCNDVNGDVDMSDESEESSES